MAIDQYGRKLPGEINDAQTIYQPTWWISNSGNDRADGLTEQTAITESERQRRWGPIARTGGKITVNYLDTPNVDVNYGVLNPRGSSLVIQGKRTVQKTGVFSAVTNINEGAQTPQAVTEATLGAIDVGRYIQITGGARSGNNSRIVKDNGAGSVRTGPFGIGNPSAFPQVTQVSPQIGDPFEVVTVPSLTVGTMNFFQEHSTLPSGSITNFADGVWLDSIEVDGGSFSEGIMGGGEVVTMTRGRFRRISLAGSSVYNVLQAGFDSAFCLAGTLNFLFGVTLLNGQCNMYPGAFINIDYNSLSQAQQLSCIDGAQVLMGKYCAFDSSIALPPIRVESNSSIVSRNFNGVGDLIWGTGNLGYGIRVLSFGAISYTTKPTINGGLGAGREALIGGTDKLWGAVPFIEPTNNAGIVVLA